jgi:hypothetical protein
MNNGRQRTGRLRWAVVASAGAALLLPLAVARQHEVGEYRQLERAYIASRQPTACNTARLAAGAFTITGDEVDEVVTELIRDARADAETERAHYRGHRVRNVLPNLRRADEQLLVTMDAQVGLYSQLLRDPAGADRWTLRIGTANNLVERNLARARNQLLTSASDDWAKRFTCLADGTDVQSDSSSSK